MTDIISALVARIKTDPTVSALSAGRIYEAELSRSESEVMARKAAVVSLAGGFETNMDLPISSPRMEVWSYGEDYYQAGVLDRAICDVLKSLNRVVSEGVLLHSVAISGGPSQYRDPGNEWPVMIRNITVLADDRDVI